MQIQVGTDDKTGHPVILDTARVVNPHVQICGVTGMGKTHRVKAMAESLVRSAAEMRRPIRVHVFNPHGDIQMDWSSTVKFSEATQYGYNPLEVNPDPDVGGPRRAIQKFLAAVKKHKVLGTKQEAVMRYLLEDLYHSRGYRLNDPRTWWPDDPQLVRQKMADRKGRIYLDVTYEQRTRFLELLREFGKGRTIGGFDDFDKDPEMKTRKSWWIEEEHYDGEFLMWEPRNLFKAAPTLDDLVRFAERKLKAMLCGTNSAAIALLGDVNRAARVFHRKSEDLAKRGQVMDDAEMEELGGQLAKAKERYLKATESYLDSIRNGRDLDDLIRYNSTDVLTSVYERLQNLRAIGVYNPIAPPFDPRMPIWDYHIKNLEIPVQRMFVDLVCARIFERAMQRGLSDDVTEVLLVDEGARYATQEEGNILDMISNEARKFGLALWICLQSPAQASDDMIKSVGTIVVVGLASADTNVAARKLGIEAEQLLKITPLKTALVQIKAKGALASQFSLVRVT